MLTALLDALIDFVGVLVGWLVDVNRLQRHNFVLS
jgi:hypothetical protein